MDRWLKLPEKKTLLPPVTDKQKADKEYDSAKRVRRFQVSWKVGRVWLHLDDDLSLMWCSYCKANTHEHADKDSFSTGTISFQLASVKAHESTTSHTRETLAVEAAAKPTMESSAGQMLLSLNKALLAKLVIKFRMVHALAKHDRPFTDYVWQCCLDEILPITLQR